MQSGYNEAIPMTAGADLSTHQGKALESDGTLAGTSLAALGVLYNAPASGEAATAVFTGRVRVKAGAAITAGARIMVTNSGNGFFSTVTSGFHSVGYALTGVASGGMVSAVVNFVSPTYHAA